MDQEEREAEQALGRLWVGCAGYSYPHWRQGVFYPKGLEQENELRHYSRVFDTCEVNTSFYGTPTEDTVAHWQQQVKGNARFHFTLKMRSVVTHGDTTPGLPGTSPSGRSAAHERSDRPFLEPLSTEALEAELPLLLERCEQLRTGKDGEFPSSLGVVLLQFPPSFAKSMEALERLARHLPGGGEAPAIAASAAPQGAYRYALEFRHASWYDEETYAFMRRQGWGLVQHALIHNIHPEKGIPEVDEVTAPFVYLRLHGKKAEHAWDYSREELQPYVDKIVAWRKQGLDCWVYFLNDADGKAPANAFDLLAMVRAACGESAPSRPEDKERQIMLSYFSKGKAGGGSAKRGRKEEEEAEASTPPSSKRPRGEKEGEEKESGGSGSGGGEGKKEEGGGGGGKTTTPKQAAAAAAAAAGSKPLTAFFKRKEGPEEGKKG